MSDLTIVIPAYNEAESLSELLPELLAFCKRENYQLIIVNDGSRDETLSVLKRFDNEDFFRFFSHKVNKGYGGAIKTGVSHVATEYCITMDADGQHMHEDVKAVLNHAIETNADMVVGSREGLKDASFYRGIGKRLIRTFAKILLPVHIYDINSGMKLFNAALGRKYLKLCPDNFACCDVIALVFISQRHLVLEKGISINKRSSGESMINTMTAVETVQEILNIVILFNPMRVFMPIAMVSIMLAFIWGAYSIIMQGMGLSVGSLLGFTTGIVFFLLGLLAEQLSRIRRSLALESE